MLVELVEAEGGTAGSLQRVAHGVNGAMRSVCLPRDRRPTRSESFFLVTCPRAGCRRFPSKDGLSCWLSNAFRVFECHVDAARGVAAGLVAVVLEGVQAVPGVGGLLSRGVV